jgi:hypothetical protein
MPLDGALAYAAYWQHLADDGARELAPTDGKLGDDLLNRVIYPHLDRILAKTNVGEIMGDGKVGSDIYVMSSGFPMRQGNTYFKIGARYLHPPTGEQLTVEYDVQPIRRRVDPSRLAVLGIDPITLTGKIPSDGIDNSRGGLKAIDNRITAWAVFDYVWYADVRQNAEPLLHELLGILRVQGMGKKRSVGFGKIVDYRILKRTDWPAGMEFDEDAVHRVFLKYAGQSILMRPLSYRAVTQSSRPVALTNLMIEYGCGSMPPYWNSREVVVREGTTFNFQT